MDDHKTVIGIGLTAIFSLYCFKPRACSSGQQTLFIICNYVMKLRESQKSNEQIMYFKYVCCLCRKHENQLISGVNVKNLRMTLNEMEAIMKDEMYMI